MNNQNTGNNKNMPANNKQTPNKNSFTWSFKDVAQRDLNNNQWPFVVIRNAGRPGKMDCRSMSVLEKSFEGTPFNLNESKRGFSRYGYLMSFLLNHKDKISKITHLAVGYSAIFFMIDGETEPRGQVYRSQLCSIEKVANGVDYKRGITKSNINQLFEQYKRSKGAYAPYELKKYVEKYISMRKNMSLLDSEKQMIEILTNPEISFSSLKYFVFLENTDMNAYDYRGYIANTLGVDCPELQSIESELRAFSSFVNELKNGKTYKNLKKVFSVPDSEIFGNNPSAPNIQAVKDMFKYCANPNSENYLQYSAPLSEKESEEVDKKIEELKKLKGTDKVDFYKEKFSARFDSINQLICDIDRLLRKGIEFVSISNAAEKSSWSEKFQISKIKTALQNEYDFKNKNLTNEERKVGLIPFKPIYTLGMAVSSERGTLVETGNINDIIEILPTYFKDDRKSLKSLGIENASGSFEDLSIKSNTDGEIALRALIRMEKQIVELYETFLGIQYGILGCYMKKFGKDGVDLCITLMPTIVNPENPLKISKNVLDVAERFIYSDLGLSLQNSDENYYDSELGKQKRSQFEGFCKGYIDKVNNTNTALLTHSEGESNNEKYMQKLLNLKEQYKCISFVFNQYEVFFRG